MKKFLVVLLALSAVFCFAGCENGKCDECGAKNNTVKVYEDWDDAELCATCAAEKLAGDIGGIFGK
jgi:hypothetical protein